MISASPAVFRCVGLIVSVVLMIKKVPGSAQSVRFNILVLNLDTNRWASAYEGLGHQPFD